MNNQYNGQYGYVNRDGKLVPSNTPKRNQTTSNVGKTQAKRQQAPVNAKETAGYNTTSTPKQSAQSVKEQPKQTYADREVERKQKTTKNEQNKTKGKGVKKLCFTLSLIMILSAAKQMPFNVNARITEIATKNSNTNYMDDVFASDETIEIVNPKNGKIQKIQLEDAINKLEDYVEICSLIDELNIDNLEYAELTEKEKKAAIALYEKEGINGLIELYKTNTSNPIEKARTARQLIFIRDHFGGAWIEQNGLKVAEAVLEKTIQTAVIEHYGTFKPTEYNVVEIPSDNEFPCFLVTIKDPISGATDDFIFTPIAAGEYAQAILMLRDLRATDGSKLSEQEKLQKIEHTLRLVKRCLNKDIDDCLGVTYTKKVK